MNNMRKEYISSMGTLEVGSNNLSDHLTWLLRMTTYLTVDKNNNAINSVIYSKDLPKSISGQIVDGAWGVFHAAPRSIVINLGQHINAVLDYVQDKRHMNNSIRVLLLRELLDTLAHEAWHAKVCIKTNNWENDDLDEQGAKDHAWELSWGIAEHYDVNVEQFGSFFDAFLQEIYKDLKEDVQDRNCKEWKKIQYHMLDNNINYYNPDSGIEIRTIREVFQAQVRPETAWVDIDNTLFTSFLPTKSIAQRIAEEEDSNTVSPDTNILSVTANTTSSTPAPINTTEQPVETKQVTATLPANYDPLGDSTCDMEDPFADDIPTPEITAPIQQAPIMDNTAIAAPITNTAAAAPAVDGSVEVQQPITPQMDVLTIQRIAEQVLRRMFHHVATKCEFNVNGGYNNTGAVLDPINISDIEGASTLFSKQDTLDANGAFMSHTDTDDFIKGLPTKDGLPRYTFYMNMGGKLHKRVFIAQNPDKKKADGTPTAFAAKAQAGDRIMMLLADGAGITADITLPIGSILGQETFKIWKKK